MRDSRKKVDERTHELTEALSQQTATSEILRVISSSPTDVQPVFEAIVQSGVQLFAGAAVAVALPDGDQVRMAAIADPDPVRRARWASVFPFPLSREYMHGSAIIDHTLIDVPDVLNPPDTRWAAGIANFANSGYRAVTVTPMMRGDTAIGAVSLVRVAPGRLTEKQVALLKTFADQAVIAIENVRLFNETKESLEQQTAMTDILGVISSSPTNVQPVLDAIAERAERLCEGGSAVVHLREGDALKRVATHGPMVWQAPALTLPLNRDSTAGRAVLEARTIHIKDVYAAKDDYPATWQLIEKFGAGSGVPEHHTMLTVPLLKEGTPIGSITVRRAEVWPFSDKQITLVQTFASQAVIAIENVRLFNEIHEKSEQLQIANRHKSEFLANMSHELRTPLNAIIGFSEVLQEHMFGDMNEKQEEYINDIHGSGKHLLSLINDILDLSKVEAGRMELELETFDLPGAIDNALTLVKERAGRHGIELASTVDPAVGEIKADERKFKQILLNLLSNAVKFTPEGGHYRGRSGAGRHHGRGERLGYRHRHRAGGLRRGVRGVPPGRQRLHEESGRHGTRPGAHPQVRRTARRQNMGDERSRQRLDIHFQPAGSRCRQSPWPHTDQPRKQNGQRTHLDRRRQRKKPQAGA